MMSEDHKANTLEMIAVMQAYVDGKPIEVKSASCDWGFMAIKPVWDWGRFIYRVATVPDSIDWDHVSPEWRYMARDAYGSVFLYDAEPLPSDTAETWQSLRSGRVADALAFASLVKGTGDWKDSLVKRPE